MKSVLLLLLTCAGSLYAQVTTAQVSGRVVDRTGAGIPRVSVRVTDQNTSATREVRTGDDGYYAVPNLPASTYSLEVKNTGFKTYVQTDIHLTAGDRLDVSPTLEVGGTTESITVQSQGERVETESGTVGALIDGSQVRELALNGRNLIQLTMLVPGVVVTTDQFDRGSTAFGGVGDFYINGMRSTSNAVTVDGGANQDSGNVVSQTNNVGVDFVQEVKVASSGYSAEYGRNAGGQVNFQTRSGTQRFSGTLFEFFRNDKLNTRSFFAPQIEQLRLNNFGWSLGGPIMIPGVFNEKRQKLFFFAGQEYKRRVDGDTRRATVPTRDERAGIINSTATLVYPSNFAVPELRGEPITDPSRATPENPTGRNILPLRYMTPNGRAIMSMFDKVEPLSTLYVDQKIANNITFQLANRDIRRQDIFKVDYHKSDKNRFNFRYLYDTGTNAVPYETGTLPTFSATRTNRARNMQAQWTSVISQSTINEFSAVSNYLFLERIPYGDLRMPSTYGLNLKEIFGIESSVYGIPSIAIAGYTTISGARPNPRSPVWDASIRDNFSHVRGKHNLKTGILVIRNRKNERTNTTLTGAYTFNNVGNLYTTGNALLDTLLGNYRQYTESDNDKFNRIRFTQVESYIADTWKVRPNLTLDVGVRYYFMTPPYTADDMISTFLPEKYNPAQAQRVIATGTNAGQLQPGVGVPGNGIARAGEGVPRGFYQNQQKFSPRFGFAWDPSGKGRFSVRGGGAIYYDRLPAGDTAIAGGNPPFVNTVTLFDGRFDDPAGGKSSDFPVSITGFRPDIVAPATYNWNFGIQKQLWFNTLLDVNYVSTQGRHLLRRPDINQVMPWVQYNNLTANINSLRPYQGYTSINMYESSAASNYHGLQTQFTRRYTSGVTFSVAYTWSKVLTDASDKNNGVENINNYRRERSHATFDRNHVLVFSYIYYLPELRNMNAVARHTLGGWQLSGVTQMQSGAWLTPAIATPTGTRRPDRVGDLSYFNPREVQTLVGGNNAPVSGNFYFDPTPGKTFIAPAPDAFGNSAPFIIRGPGRHNWDLSLFKNFKWGERRNVQFRAEAFNVWNHVSFRNPNLSANSRDYGTIADAGPPRLLQLGLKFLF